MTTTATIALHARDDEPLPDCSTLMGLLHVLRKAHIELAGEDVAHARFRQIATRGDARQYIDELMPPLMRKRQERRLHRHGGKK